MYSSSHNDVPGVAQRYGTIAEHTRRCASVLVVFVVFCVHMHSFASLIRRTPPPTFSDTAITNRHPDTTSFQLRAHWVRISWSIGSAKSFGHVPPVGVTKIFSSVALHLSYEGKSVCVYSNSRNDVPRVAQRYGTIAEHTRRRASVLVVFVVFCVHMHSFAGLIRRTPPPTFSDTAITDRHSDTTIFQLTGCGYPGLLDRKNGLDMCPRWESNPRLLACKASTLSTRPGSPLKITPVWNIDDIYIDHGFP